MKKILLTFYEPCQFEKHICDTVVRVSDRALLKMRKLLDHRVVKFYIMKDALDMQIKKRKKT